MNGFKIKKVQSLTLGEKMRQARNEKRIVLSEVSRNTKIQLEYLEYLENGDYGKLPADVYVRGFLKSFAEYVGINEDYLIKSFNKEKSIQKNIEGGEKETVKTQKINLSRFSINPKIISVILISLFFLGLIFYLYRNLNNFVSNPSLVILNPANNSIVEESSVAVQGKTDIGNNLFINNQPVLVDDEGGFNERIVLKEGTNIISVRSVNQFNKEISESISVEAHYEIPHEETNDNPEEQSPDENQNTEGEENLENSAPENLTPESDAEVLGVETQVVTDEKADTKKKKKK